MDIISHTLTGIAVGTVIASFSKRGLKDKATLLGIGALGGALPDFDAISLWSKFDSVIGGPLNLQYSGKEIYFSKLWYSHHGAFHSILAPILLLILFTLLMMILKKLNAKGKTLDFLIKLKLRYATFFGAFLFHLLEDMPTPSGVWGGVNLIFPNKEYLGGFGKIWWWNNYDIFLIICTIILLNLIINILPNTLYRVKTKMTLSIFCIGLTLASFQILNRPIDFNYTGHTQNYSQYELDSKKVQKDILGEKLYNFMEYIDRKIPLYF